MKIAWKKLGMIGLLAACLVLMWQSLRGFGDAYPALSLRWREPLSVQQVDAVRREGTQDGYSATFWREERGTAKTDLAELEAVAVRYQGEQSKIQRLTFLEGTGQDGMNAPAGMVSEGFALALWGSTDVVGQTFTWKGETCCVSAVFQGEEALLFLPQKDGAYFDCLELKLNGASDPVAAVSDLLAVAGVDDCQGAVYGPEMGAMLGALGWLPLTACGIWALVRLVRLYPIQRKWVRRGLFWGTLFLLAVLIPVGIAHLPGWLTPPRWSDFGFWARLFQAGGERVAEWLRVAPVTKDVEAKRFLLGWAFGWTGSLFCLNWLCYRVGKEEEFKRNGHH